MVIMENRVFRILLVLWFLALAFYGYRMVSLVDKANAMLEVANNFDAYKSLDAHYFGFTVQQAKQTLEALGEQALPQYKHIEEVEDFWYPIGYGILLCLTILLLGWRTTWPKLAILVASCMPLLAMFLDFYENHYIVQLIDQYPNLRNETVQTASKYNIWKWLFVTIACIEVVVLLIIRLMKKRKRTTAR